MNEEEKLSWSALEYEEKERSVDWFWALGIIVVASAATAIIYGNYFFTILIILSGILLGIFAKKKPVIVSYELNDKGLMIENRIYLYKNIKAFYVQNILKNDGEKKYTLFINSERLFMPVMGIPIEENMAEKIYYTMLSQNIPEKEMKEHPSEKIMETLGF